MHELLLDLAHRAQSQGEPFIELEVEAAEATRNRGWVRVLGVRGHVVREVFKPRESPKLVVCLCVRDVLERLQDRKAA